jgi:hypothetical protein
MSTSVQSLTFSQTTDAQFRAWGSGIAAGLIAAGLIQTADTGQINWTTVLTPSGTNQSRGYEIYRFSDALQATRPVFIKIEYGSFSSALFPSIWITVGTSTDGAGTINSMLQSARRQFAFSAAVGTVQNCYFSGDGSYINFMIPNSSVQLMQCIERTRSAAGVATNEGLSWYGYAQNTAGGSQETVLSFLNLTVGTGTAPTFVWAGTHWSTAVVGADVYFFPRITPVPKVTYDLALMLGYQADLVNLTPISVTNCGAAHTYLPYLGLNPTITSNNGASVSAMMRYE